jgi:hypothetical protein
MHIKPSELTTVAFERKGNGDQFFALAPAISLTAQKTLNQKQQKPAVFRGLLLLRAKSRYGATA